MRRAAKVDDNQAAIVDLLRAVGATVESLARVGNGVPDLLVGFRGVNWLLEVKAPKGALTDDQAGWHPLWRGQVAIVRSADEALKVIGATK
jgi:hypothetical protein